MTEITNFLAAWTGADRDGDTTSLEAKLTGDFVGVGPLGFVLNKPAWLARHQGDNLRYQTTGRAVVPWPAARHLRARPRRRTSMTGSGRPLGP
ncbi:MAG: nuclear transport factor 2 family protein [Actinomycetota bacterium]|nr:nuclear transport factor 2 family protein [Actinomycetota bacterium]